MDMLHLLRSSTSTPKILLHGNQWEAKAAPGGSSGLLGRRDNIALDAEGLAPRIKQMLNKVELSVSSYDTAWVAMVPSKDSSKQPSFPKCLNWVMENQGIDGSWGLDPSHPLLVKDSLSCTLACVLALQKWKVGQQLIHKGLDFIVSNIWAATDKNQHSPLGFDIIFPGMIEYANHIGLNLSVNQPSMEAMFLKRDLETKSLKDKTSNLAYFAEGLTQSCDWKEIMKYQRMNGSLFNSPSTTAATFIYLHDGKCFEYLDTLVKNFENAVPTVYPLDLYARLSVVDNLQKLGIDRYFREEIEVVLSEVYRKWMLGSEEIILDARCCAMAFRLLRMNGYEISADGLSNVEEQEKLLYAKDTKSILELFKASQVTIFADEPVLDRIYAWTSTCLNDMLVNGAISEKNLQIEVDYALKHPHACLERIESRMWIENYNADNLSLLKTSYRFCNVDYKDLWKFSIQDFNVCQAIHREELEHLEGWIKKYGINNLKYTRPTIRYAFFAIASTFFQPNFSNTRMSWAKNSVLATAVDDFFDFAGSMEELLNLIDLIERWDQHSTIDYKSKEVEILFGAIYGTTNELAAKASIQQGRCIKRQLIDIWINFLKANLKEAEWARNKTIPTINEYLSNGYISFGLGPIILISLYFLEPLSEEVVTSEEYKNLFMHTSLIARLINDRVTVEREGAQGKLNSVSLQVVLSGGAVTKEDAQEEVKRLIESHRRELLRMVLQTEESTVPKVCKDLFWRMNKVLHLFYMSGDGFSSPSKMVNAVNAIINEPIILP
ncbi:hypothetical protein GH714_027368 [Hevea brasiliensis]|uniref:ent-kaurene synthase n=1 Tax=Hevea brasiliensis TaxID=3981 RepID=A0A6A6N410_HEVBR|nr:hypothetical protein GH714_027368 [Hevea brasiliensis]